VAETASRAEKNDKVAGLSGGFAES